MPVYKWHNNHLQPTRLIAMFRNLLTSLLLLLFSTTSIASDNHGDELIRTIEALKEVIQNNSSAQQAHSSFDKLKNTRAFDKGGHYLGHQVFDDNEVSGLLSVHYQNGMPQVAGYTSVPLRVRHATRKYKNYRETLLNHYKEDSYNHFALGDGIIAKLDKEQRSVSISVYRK
ncbi:MAG: hypothetical protein PVJ63_02850 [Thioalkalispiraceae bacterium]